MKISFSLIKEWLNFDLSIKTFIKQLNFIGIEVESYQSCNIPFLNNKFIIGKIIKIIPILFKIDKKFYLIYKVKVNKYIYINILNKYKFSNDNLLNKKIVINFNKINYNNNKIIINYLKKYNNIIIKGNICTYYDIGLDKNKNSKIIILNDYNILIGHYLTEYLDLKDYIIKINPLNNRLDHFNILNIAREILIYNYRNKKINFNYLNKKIVKREFLIKFNYYKNNKNKFCYININIKNIDNKLILPLWIYEKLYNLDIPIFNSILDIINFVYINTGLLINFKNFNNIKGINLNKYYNTVPTYFDEYNLKNNKNIILEIKFYNSNYINNNKSNIVNRKIQKYLPFLNIDYKIYIYVINFLLKFLKNNNSDKIFIYKFVIFNLQRTNLLNKYIIFNKKNIKNKIGINIKNETLFKIFFLLKFKTIIKDKKILIYINKWRTDINLEINLIEEIIKFNSYLFLYSKSNIIYKNINNIKLNDNYHYYYYNILYKIKLYLVYNEYNEVLNYSFVNPYIQNKFFNKNYNIKIINPLSKEQSILRQSLLFGLIDNIKYNYIHNNIRLKFFEIGNCYYLFKNKYYQFNKLGLIILGNKFITNWNTININNKFNIYDIKEISEFLLELLKLKINYIQYSYKIYKFFNKNESLKISYLNKCIGFLGKINLNLFNNSNKYESYFLELNLDKILKINNNKKIFIKKIYHHPIIKRDISIILKNKININYIINTIKTKIRKFLINIFIFDIYRNNLEFKKYKNIGIRLELQDQSIKSKFNDIRINNLIFNLIKILKKKYKIIFRKN